MPLRRSCVLALLLGACATQPDVSELITQPVVATKYDPNIDFGTFETFAVNPTVPVVRDVGDGGTISTSGTLSSDTAASIVDRVTAHMTMRGYRLVAVSERPQLGVQMTVFLQINVATVVSPGYWWGAPGYTSAPAYWGFPSSSYFAPWSYSSTAYRSGTLVIEVVDLRDAASIATIHASASGRLEVVWAAYAHAVAPSLLTSLTPDALAAIDQAFLQSPYLERRPTEAR
jgi:hypothetical protein